MKKREKIVKLLQSLRNPNDKELNCQHIHEFTCHHLYAFNVRLGQYSNMQLTY